MADWSEELCLRLIELYRQHELLWSMDHKEYLRKSLKEEAWRKISSQIGKTPEECKAKIINLTASWRREYRKSMKTTTGPGANKGRVSRWFAFQALAFLSKRNNPRSTLNSVNSIAIERMESANEDRNCENVDDRGSEQGSSAMSTSTENFMSSTKKRKISTSKNLNVDEQLTMMVGAYDILKTVADRVKTPPAPIDETTLFFNYVSAKVQNYSSQTKRGVQHAIFDILMKADDGFYEWSDFHNQYGSQPNHLDNRYGQASATPLIQASPRLSPSISPPLSPLPSP